MYLKKNKNIRNEAALYSQKQKIYSQQLKKGEKREWRWSGEKGGEKSYYKVVKKIIT